MRDTRALHRRFFFFALVLFLFDCASERPPVPPRFPSDPTELLAAIRAREDAVRTLRARFRAETRVDGEARSADGVLLVAKPDRVRLRLMLPFGLTIFDLLSRGGQVRTSSPFRQGDRSDSTGDVPSLAWEDLGGLFLRGTHAFPGSCRPIDAGEPALRFVCRECNECPAERTIEVDRRRGTILREVTYEDDAVRLEVDYGDYRSVEDASLPFDIRLGYPGRSLSVRITAERYEVNPELPDELFR